MSKKPSFLRAGLSLSVVTALTLILPPANASLKERVLGIKDQIIGAVSPMQHVSPAVQQEIRDVISKRLMDKGDVFKNDAADPKVQNFIITSTVKVLLQDSQKQKMRASFSPAEMMPMVLAQINKWAGDKMKGLQDNGVPAKLVMGANRVNIYQPNIEEKIKPFLSGYLTVQMLKNEPMTSKILVQRIKEDLKNLQSALGVLTVDSMVEGSKQQLKDFTNSLLRDRGHILNDHGIDYFVTSAAESMKEEDARLKGKMAINLMQLQELIRNRVEALPSGTLYKK